MTGSVRQRGAAPSPRPQRPSAAGPGPSTRKRKKDSAIQSHAKRSKSADVDPVDPGAAAQVQRRRRPGEVAAPTLPSGLTLNSDGALLGQVFSLPSWPPRVADAYDVGVRFYYGARMEPSCVLQILTAVREILSSEPNVVHRKITNPVCVVGDLHGQFHDLFHIFQGRGWPSRSRPYVFNGDFVDRGPFGVEVVLLLCLLKVLHPEFVHLNRGNHETMQMGALYGFDDELQRKFGGLRTPGATEDSQEADPDYVLSESQQSVEEEEVDEDEDGWNDDDDDDEDDDEDDEALGLDEEGRPLARVRTRAAARREAAHEDEGNCTIGMDGRWDMVKRFKAGGVGAGPSDRVEGAETPDEDMILNMLFPGPLRQNGIVPCLFEQFGRTFQALPLCTCLQNRVLIVHGGLSPRVRTLKAISKISRACEPTGEDALGDLLWSDPWEDNMIEELACSIVGLYTDPRLMVLVEGWADGRMKWAQGCEELECRFDSELRELLGELKRSGCVRNVPRGCAGMLFGSRVTDRFLRANQLDLLIRSHQSVGSGFQLFHNDRGCTVFSAPNYCESGESASFLVVDRLGVVTVHSYVQVQPPAALCQLSTALEPSVAAE